jgi:hypothetical protein
MAATIEALQPLTGRIVAMGSAGSAAWVVALGGHVLPLVLLLALLEALGEGLPMRLPPLGATSRDPFYTAAHGITSAYSMTPPSDVEKGRASASVHVGRFPKPLEPTAPALALQAAAPSL